MSCVTSKDDQKVTKAASLGFETWRRADRPLSHVIVSSCGKQRLLFSVLPVASLFAEDGALDAQV